MSKTEQTGRHGKSMGGPERGGSRKEHSITLSPKLKDAFLTLRCRQCDHPIVKKGSWFKAVTTLKCTACGYTQPFGYVEKLKLFDKHAHLL